MPHPPHHQLFGFWRCVGSAGVKPCWVNGAGGWTCGWKGAFFLTVWNHMQPPDLRSKLIDFALQARCERLLVQFPGTRKKKKQLPAREPQQSLVESSSVFESGNNLDSVKHHYYYLYHDYFYLSDAVVTGLNRIFGTDLVAVLLL